MHRPTLRHLLMMMAVLLFPAVAHSQQAASPDSLARRLDQLQRQVDSLRRAAQRQDARLIALDERAAPPGPAMAGDSARRPPLSSLGIYGKPFVRRFGSGTSVGGYMDIEFANDFTTGARSFDQRRLVPFIYSEISDRLHFGTEIEFEHGVQIENAAGVAEGSGAIEVEFATLDYRLTEGFNVRAGVILSPLGRFNLVHDSPIQELTDRPLMARHVIPSTLSEAGAGVFGTFYPSATSLVSYELYAVNGFSAALGTPDGKGRLPIRDARGQRGDLDGRAPIDLVGRVTLSPRLGVELGASAHVGPYGDDLRAEAGRGATIWALDATINRGPFDLLGEYARLSVDIDPALRAPAVGEGRDGFFVQANWHFAHGVVPPRATSSFTAVVRAEQVDYKRGVTGDVERRGTIGLNWRPVPDAALKGEAQFTRVAPSGSATFGDTAKRLVLSMATYF